MRCFTLILIFTLLAAAAGSQIVEGQFGIKNEDRYLIFPVRDSDPPVIARIFSDGTSIDRFAISLAVTEPDYWVFFDASRYRGKTLSVRLEGDANTKLLERVRADSRYPGQENVYKERLRPQASFSSQRGWINDPNGLIYYAGEYHMYYQHNPYGWPHANMHWGHAVSTDLLHWKELPPALYIPDQGQAFSGTATVDPKNTSGFRRNGIDPLIAFYTRTGSGEHIALSYDNGLTFEEYAGNPVVKHMGRDPKVFWYEPGSHWVMAVYDERPNARPMALGQSAQVRGISIYTSPDLKDWAYQSTTDGFFECPELFEIAVDGEPGLKKWIMYDADGEYVVGDFDGKQFKIEQSFRQYDFGGGGNFYASQTFANIPKKDGRRIQIGWLRNITTPGMPFNQSMGFPTELKLKKAFDGWRLTPSPIREISTLHADSYVAQERVLTSGEAQASPVQGDTLHIVASFDPGDARQIGLNINGYRFAYNRMESRIGPFNYVPRRWDDFKIEAIVDKINIQIFVNDGEMYLVVPYNSVDAEKVVEAFADMRFPGLGGGRVSQPAGTGGRGIQGGARGTPPTGMALPRTKAILKQFEVHTLKSIWETAR